MSYMQCPHCRECAPRMRDFEKHVRDCRNKDRLAVAIPTVETIIQSRQTPFWGYGDYIRHSAHEAIRVALNAVEAEARRIVGAGAQSALSVTETALANLRKELENITPQKP